MMLERAYECRHEVFDQVQLEWKVNRRISEGAGRLDLHRGEKKISY